ncbi:MAG: OsmC family protein [Mycobacterium sp.]
MTITTNKSLPEQTKQGTVTVAETGRGRYAQHITAGHHEFAADEPHPIGDDTGPSPYDLLLAALGACTSMTLRMYAERKGWALEHVRVDLRHRRIHAQDCAECTTTAGFIDHVDRDITLSGELDTGQRDRLIQIADQCPVHRTLHSEIHVPTTEH